MPDLLYLITRWWKPILVLVIASVLTVTIVLFFIPPKYLSVATALPASSFNTDKASIFSSNIQQLYPATGSPDDLDAIIGTAQLDTVYIAVANETTGWGSAKDYRRIKSNTRVIKSEYGALKVKVWDNDKTLAARMANAIMEKLQQIHQDLVNSRNVAVIAALESGRDRLLKSDSVANPRSAAITEEVSRYEKLIAEYRLLIDNKPPVLITVEPAREAIKADRPDRLLILPATALLSFLFGLLTALVLEKRKPAVS